MRGDAERGAEGQGEEKEQNEMKIGLEFHTESFPWTLKQTYAMRHMRDWRSSKIDPTGLNQIELNISLACSCSWLLLHFGIGNMKYDYIRAARLMRIGPLPIFLCTKGRGF